MNPKYNANEALLGGKQFIQMTLPRLESLGTPMEGFLVVRSAIARIQIAATEVLGSHFLETRIGEAEFQGVMFKHCTFKKVSFDALNLRQVRFENCTFEEVSFQTPMDPAAIDGVEFHSCFIQDPQGVFHPLLSKKEWTFHTCVIAASHSVENDTDNTYLPLLAFVAPKAVEEPKKVIAKPMATTPAPTPTPHAATPAPAPAPEPKARPAAGRFDQLEIG